MGKLRPVVFILAVCGASLFIVSYLNLRILTEKDFAEQRLAKKNAQIEASRYYYNMSASIEKYQAEYFEIIKRNNILLLSENNDETENDKKQLSELFEFVISEINPQNPYLLQYKNIENKYAENTGNNTIEISRFVQEKYTAIKNLLENVYQSVLSTLTDEEAKILENNENSWFNQVQQYEKFFETLDYGSIKPIIKMEYETNMYAFRALLLMLYLN